MPISYEVPGQLAGAGAGGFMGRLGELLSPLDMPRRSAWNLIPKLSEGDWQASLPGLVTAAGLASTPFLGPIGALLGAMAGGGLQAAGESLDQERYAAPTPEDAARELGLPTEGIGGFLSSLALGMAGDPLTVAGTSVGGMAGRKLGKMAEAYGPRFPGGVEKLERIMHTMPEDEMSALTTMFGASRSPQAAAIAAEFPESSRFFAAGGEGVLFESPELPGGLLRIGKNSIRNPESGLVQPPPPRVTDPMMLQPVRDVAHGPYRVETVPKVEAYAEPGVATGLPFQEQQLAEFRSALAPMEEAIRARGLEPLDFKPSNIGRLPGGEYVVIDPNSIDLPAGATQAERLGEQPGPIGKFILDLIRSPSAARRELAKRLSETPTGGLLPDEMRTWVDRATAPTAVSPPGSPAPMMPAVPVGGGLGGRVHFAPTPTAGASRFEQPVPRHVQLGLPVPQSAAAKEALGQFESLLENIDNASIADIDKFITNHVKWLSKPEVDELLAGTGIAGKHSKTKGIEQLRTILRQQAEMSVKAGGMAGGQEIRNIVNEVNAAIERMPRTQTSPTQRGTMFGENKFFIGSVFDEIKKKYPNLTRDEFDRMLLDASNTGRLMLSRADLVQAMHPEDVRLSNVGSDLGVKNFITRG